MTMFWLLASIAGAAIALQAVMNARLGVLLHNPLLATTIAFGCACLVTLVAVLLVNRSVPDGNTLQKIPLYLWGAGLLSAFGVGTFYYLIPKMGAGPMMSWALGGQILLAMLISHMGWFDLPIKPITLTKGAGVIFLILGILLINRS